MPCLPVYHVLRGRQIRVRFYPQHLSKAIRRARSWNRLPAVAKRRHGFTFVCALGTFYVRVRPSRTQSLQRNSLRALRGLRVRLYAQSKSPRSQCAPCEALHTKSLQRNFPSRPLRALCVPPCIFRTFPPLPPLISCRSCTPALEIVQIPHKLFQNRANSA